MHSPLLDVWLESHQKSNIQFNFQESTHLGGAEERRVLVLVGVIMLFVLGGSDHRGVYECGAADEEQPHSAAVQCFHKMRVHATQHAEPVGEVTDIATQSVRCVADRIHSDPGHIWHAEVRRRRRRQW